MQDDDPVTLSGRTRAATVLALLGYLTGATLLVAAVTTGRPGADSGSMALALIALPPTILLGLLVGWRRGDSPVGPALVFLAASPALAWALESWLPTPAAAGAWVYNLTGFALLCLVFPDGLLPGRGWRAMPWLVLAVTVLVHAELAWQFDRSPGERVPVVLDIVSLATFLTVLAASVGSLVVRYRRGGERTRTQLRWLMLGAGSVPVLLAAGWVADATTAAAPGVTYAGFLAAMLILLPLTVAAAILRHDLLDIDRLLSESVSWLATTLVSAAIFAAVVIGVAQLGTQVLEIRAASQIGVTAAAFVAALGLAPAHRRIQAAVGRLLDRERTVTTAALREYVRQVRDGAAEPESVEQVLRAALDDDGLRVLLRAPGGVGYLDLGGAPAEVPRPGDGPGADEVIPLTAQDSEVGAIVLGRSSAARSRRARAAAVEVRLPIEVSRLRLELRQALEDASTSRARLVEAASLERRRLERDLHDGAQQRIVAVGMRLRSVQRRLPQQDATYQDLDAAVLALEAVVAELRRLAHGVRPSQLDDGLGVALRELVVGSPIPVQVSVELGADGPEVGEAVVTTAYFVVAECLANTLKHARASGATVLVTRPAGRLTIEVRDDGCGGASTGFGLRALADRVGALGGRLAVLSPAGGGTTVRAEL